MNIENIVIGKPLIAESKLFASDEKDWSFNEKKKTFYTQERFLPKILVEIGVYPSISEIRRNRKDLMITLESPTFIDKLKVGKKKYVWILVGE